jgi:UDP-N-acetylglucosamine--N-acetylmuramyl-(pentapeptide) pyrophosphoryl-undecaprenol N-acetylglucosamine transferase
LKIVHQTGAAEFEQVRDAYAKYDVEADVAPFFDDMPGAFASADLVVCRAGPSAVAELCAAGKASILVPYPYAADQHQMLNARSQAGAGGALLVEDLELTGERMVRDVEALWSNPAELARMENAARARAKPGAARRAALLLERLGGVSANA